MSIVLVVDLPTWFVGTTGVCALAVFVWQGRTRTVRYDSRVTPAHGDDAWYVVPDMTPHPVDEATPGAGKLMPVDVIEPDELVRSVAQTAPVALPVRLANTTPAQYYYTTCGSRIYACAAHELFSVVSRMRSAEGWPANVVSPSLNSPLPVE